MFKEEAILLITSAPYRACDPYRACALYAFCALYALYAFCALCAFCLRFSRSTLAPVWGWALSQVQVVVKVVPVVEAAWGEEVAQVGGAVVGFVGVAEVQVATVAVWETQTQASA